MVGLITILSVTCISVIISILLNLKIKIGAITFSPYWLIALCGAAAVIIFGYVTFSDAMRAIFSARAMNPVKILALFFSLTVISVFLDECGFFSYLAGAVASKAKASQIRLFVYFYLTVSIMTVFTSNDIVILTFTPFICCFARRAKISAVPFIVSEFVAANTWSMFLLIGNPTNIYIATSLEVGFFEYMRIMALPTLFAGVTSFTLLFLIFNKQLRKPIEPCEQAAAFENKSLCILSLCALAVCIVLLSISSFVGLEMWLIALVIALITLVAAACIMLIKHMKLTMEIHAIERLPYELIPFLLSFFIMVTAIERGGLASKIGELFNNGYPVLSYGFASFITSNVINNIPMSVLFADVLSQSAANTAGIYASIIGSNLGAFLTPVGALAGIMYMNILRKEQVSYSFSKFIGYGAIIALPCAPRFLGCGLRYSRLRRIA